MVDRSTKSPDVPERPERPERPLRIWRWVLVLVALNLAWRTVRYGLGFPMWGDEAFVAVNILTRDFLGLAEPLTHYQIVPLLYLWIDNASYELLGPSEYALRLPAYLAGLASMLLFVPLARHMLPRHGMFAAISIFAASYYPVRHAAEIKPYSTDLLVALTLLLLAWRAHRAPGRFGHWLTLGAGMTLSVWLSYPAAFIGGGIVMVLALDALRRRAAGEAVVAGACGVALSASFITMYLLFGAGQAEAGSSLFDSNTWSFTFPPLSEPWLIPAWFLDVHTGAMFAYPVGGNHYGSAVTFLLVVLGGVALWRGGRSIVVLLLLSPLLLMFIAAALEKYPYGGSARVAQHMAPAICLLAGHGVLVAMRWFMSPRRTVGALRIFACVMVAFILIGIGRDIGEPFKKAADAVNKQTVQALAAQTPADALWIIFGDVRDTPHAPDLREWGGSAARFRFNLLRFAPVEIRWAPAPDELVNLPAQPTWFIVYRDNKAPLPEELITPYLDALTLRYGEPMREEYPHGERDETMIVYRFD